MGFWFTQVAALHVRLRQAVACDRAAAAASAAITTVAAADWAGAAQRALSRLMVKPRLMPSMRTAAIRIGPGERTIPLRSGLTPPSLYTATAKQMRPTATYRHTVSTSSVPPAKFMARSSAASGVAPSTPTRATAVPSARVIATAFWERRSGGLKCRGGYLRPKSRSDGPPAIRRAAGRAGGGAMEAQPLIKLSRLSKAVEGEGAASAQKQERRALFLSFFRPSDGAR